MTLTPFWHRRLCEVIAVLGALIIGLYIWSMINGISNDPSSHFYVSPLAAAISVGAIILSGLAYFVVPEVHRTKTVYAAYWILLFAIATLNLLTGSSNSPFIATWMIAVIFAGIFGSRTLAIIFIGAGSYLGYTLFTDQITSADILSFILAGGLPVLVSYILWHGKSSSDKTKERAYYDLANELNQVSNKAEVVIGAISDGVLAVNNQGQIELINPAAQQIVGWGHQDALNLDYKSVLHMLNKEGSEIDKSTDPVFSVLSTNQPVRRNDLQLQTSSGKKITIEIVVSPIGRLGSGAIIVFRDVTKEQEEERAQAEFISTASHEMRTPVASIEGYLGLALNPATAKIDDKARDFILKAHASAEHLGRLFQDLLDVTKADDGRISNNPKAINIVEFLNEIIEGLKPKADEKNLRLFFKPLTSDDNGLRNIAPVFYVNVDNDHLREVMANLIENAIKYTPAGEVVIDVKGDDTHVVVSITDSGIGIPAEDIPHLFQKFYRVDNSDTREIGGTGLGLYLCRRLVEAMNGRIWVDSEYKKGSTFSVELERISHEDAMHLIEAASAETSKSTLTTIQPSVIATNSVSAKERAATLATPIIMEHSPATRTAPSPQTNSPVTVQNSNTNPVVKPLAATPSFQPKASAEEVTVDPLLGNTPTKEAPGQALPRPATVLPPNLQAIKPQVMTSASQPASPQPTVESNPATATPPPAKTTTPAKAPDQPMANPSSRAPLAVPERQKT